MESKENYELTPEKFMRTQTIIHLGISFGVLAFGIFSYLDIGESFINYSNTDDMFLYILPSLALLCVFGGNYLFQQKLNDISQKNTLREKLAEYQTASIIKYALIEAPAFLGIFLFQNEGNLVYLFVSGSLIIYLLIQKPTRLKIETDLNLYGEQRNQFNQTGQIIS